MQGDTGTNPGLACHLIADGDSQGEARREEQDQGHEERREDHQATYRMTHEGTSVSRQAQVLVIVAQDVVNAPFDTVNIPLPLIPDHGAQQRINVAERVQQIASQLPLLSDVRDLPGQLDHMAQDRPLRA